MSLEAMTWALGADVGDPTHKLVLIGLANHAHKNGRNSWASKPTIAEYVGCHPKTVQRHLRELLAEGWIRLGDQQQVAHIRADRRPIVYDLAMSEVSRDAWRAASTPALRGSDLHPRAGDDDGTPGLPRSTDEGTPLLPRADHDGGAHGGTPAFQRGSAAVSPEPRTNQGTSPQPPASGGPCARPGPTPHTNCRGCGTTNRQLEDQRRREAADRRRAEERQVAADERAAAAARPRVDPETIRRAREAAKAGL